MIEADQDDGHCRRYALNGPQLIESLRTHRSVVECEILPLHQIDVGVRGILMLEVQADSLVFAPYPRAPRGEEPGRERTHGPYVRCTFSEDERGTSMVVAEIFGDDVSRKARIRIRLWVMSIATPIALVCIVGGIMGFQPLLALSGAILLGVAGWSLRRREKKLTSRGRKIIDQVEVILARWAVPAELGSYREQATETRTEGLGTG